MGSADAVALQPDTWNLLDMLQQAPGFGVLADTLSELVDQGQPIVVCTADLKFSNGLVEFQTRHPDRFVQFGISEQNMVTAAAGMATVGLKPYVATFASFLALLCCEQIRTDVAYPGLPVRLIGHHSGITLGFYGTSHHATEDLAITRSIAGLTIIAPADSEQLRAALTATVDLPGPVYMRIGRGRDVPVYQSGMDFVVGQAIEHGHGRDLTIIATGSMLEPSLSAISELNAEGFSVGCLDMHTIKPVDAKAILEAAERSRVLMTVEEHNVIGGLGGAAAEVLADAGASTRLFRHGVQDRYAAIGPPTHLYSHYKLDSLGIAAVARRVISA